MMPINLKANPSNCTFMKRIGIADTTFARVDMARAAVSTIKKEASVQIVRYTVPESKTCLWQPKGCWRKMIAISSSL